MNDAVEQWKVDRPEVIQKLVDRVPPDQFYRLKTTGQRGWVAAYAEDGTVRMYFPMEMNYSFDLEVFGIDPGDLEVCEDTKPTFMAEAAVQTSVIHWVRVNESEAIKNPAD